MSEFTYRLALRFFRGAPVKKKHPVLFSTWIVDARSAEQRLEDACLRIWTRNLCCIGIMFTYIYIHRFYFSFGEERKSLLRKTRFAFLLITCPPIIHLEIRLVLLLLGRILDRFRLNPIWQYQEISLRSEDLSQPELK